MRAEQGYHTGGISYGYRTEPVDPGRLDGYKRLQLEETQAATVRRIFEVYADGASPRNIAARLNDESVPSPGSKWKRTSRRSDGKWLATSVLSVLNNPLYTGTVRHGATYWHTLDRRDDGTRMPTAATDPVIERHEERLRIISDELWSRVKQRQMHRSRVAGARVKAGLRRRKPGGGRDGKYLLSGLLKCSVCHGSYALSNKVRYQCSSHHEGGPGACDVSLSVPRTRVENVIRGYVEDELLDPARLLEIGERYRAAAGSEIVIDHGPRIAKLEQERANVVAAIKAGGLVVELGAELKELTAELARLKSERPKPLRAPRKMDHSSFMPAITSAPRRPTPHCYKTNRRSAFSTC